MQSTTPAGSLDERIQKSAQILGKPAEQVEQELTSILGPKSADWQGLVESEEYVKFGDLMGAFHDNSKQPSPIALVRKAATILRGGKGEAGAAEATDNPRMSELKKLFGINPTLKTVDPSDLFRAYMADKPNDPVTVELKRRYGDKPVVAFRPGTKEVAVEETIAYVTDLAQGLPEQTSVYVDGDLTRLYAVGRSPAEMIDEDPLFPGQPLIRGRSTANSINWTEVPLEARQLISIAAVRGEADINNRLNMIELVKKAREGGFKAVKELFPEAALEFNDRKEEGTLPKLKIRVNGGKGNHPFLGRNRTW